MIDAMWLSPTVHLINGTLVLVLLLVAVAVLGTRAVRRKPLDRWSHLWLILAQVAIMVQALLGIKLLDQGLGPAQLYIHYLGGLAPLGFLLVYYWLPERARQGRWLAVGVTISAFLFAVMAHTIGSAYVAGTV